MLIFCRSVFGHSCNHGTKILFFFFLPEIYAHSQANTVDKLAIKFMYSVKTECGYFCSET